MSDQLAALYWEEKAERELQEKRSVEAERITAHWNAEAKRSAAFAKAAQDRADKFEVLYREAVEALEKVAELHGRLTQPSDRFAAPRCTVCQRMSPCRSLRIARAVLTKARAALHTAECRETAEQSGYVPQCICRDREKEQPKP